MKIFAYTENYAHKTVTFIINELKLVDNSHDLLLGYSTRINPDLFNIPKMVHLPYQYDRFTNKLRWWLENFNLYYWLSNTSFKRSLNNQLSKFKPDLIHCHFGTDFLKVIANLDSSNKTIPVLVSFYGFDVTEKIKNKAILDQYKKYLNAYNVYSIAVAKSLALNVNTTITPKNPTSVLHSGIDTDFYVRKNMPMKPNEYIFLQVSSYLQKKGHHDTLEVFKKFISQDSRYSYKFILVGFGPLENEVKERIRELGLENHVSMHDPVSPEEMVDLCSKVNCFVQMSITADNGDMEGLPNVLLEAMAMELPILSTRHAGIPDIVLEGENGILCDEKNKDQYLEGFKKIVDWKLCPNSRERVIEKFSLNSHMVELEKLYSEIVKLK